MPAKELVSFHCLKYPGLSLVVTSKDEDENGKTVHFANGVFATDDSKVVDFIESHELYKNGTIVDSLDHLGSLRSKAIERLGIEAKALGLKIVPLKEDECKLKP